MAVVRLGFVAAFAAVLFGAGSAHAQSEVIWDVDRAQATGTGCTAGVDTFFIAAGSDVAILFSGMAIDLNTHQGPNAGNTRCKVRIPLLLRETVFVNQLSQDLHYGWAKDSGTRGSLATQARIFLQRLSAIEVDLPEGIEGVEPWRTESRTDALTRPPNWCNRQAQRGFFELDFEVHAKRRRRSDSISVRIHGEDLRYEAEADWLYCPR
jgi:hypothetical protein